VITKALIILENEFRLKHIRLEQDLDERIEQMCLDVNQIEQVFINILINAVHATDENGRVSIKSRSLPRRAVVRIEIADTGCGIPSDNLTKIFEPFFSTKEKGTGLGLAVSYGIVKNHGGSIWVSSKPGQGAQFNIDLPTNLKCDCPGRVRKPLFRRHKF
jgi:signal transduction histidine kinase